MWTLLSHETNIIFQSLMIQSKCLIWHYQTQQQYISCNMSPYSLHICICWVYIYQGPKQPYKEVSVDMDVALVNKSCNQLKDKLRVPACWYQSKNKGMEQHMGRWVLPDRADDEVPSSDAHDDWVWWVWSMHFSTYWQLDSVNCKYNWLQGILMYNGPIVGTSKLQTV